MKIYNIYLNKEDFCCYNWFFRIYKILSLHYCDQQEKLLLLFYGNHKKCAYVNYSIELGILVLYL